ncbi:hypothetical protein [Deinococcus roseus]|uniref:Uncharacterized protein n=1 Tax=Deinococcus roseus TaxID=392414 RepID=A0ABQ2D806_9DEIO|nr:hypothetical protein [Deinococcus roseus]GGJ47121.1 hypothetical protein GCM10008938_36490 [Deinococcus roseus]
MLLWTATIVEFQLVDHTAFSIAHFLVYLTEAEYQAYQKDPSKACTIRYHARHGPPLEVQCQPAQQVLPLEDGTYELKFLPLHLSYR